MGRLSKQAGAVPCKNSAQEGAGTLGRRVELWRFEIEDSTAVWKEDSERARKPRDKRIRACRSSLAERQWWPRH